MSRSKYEPKIEVKKQQEKSHANIVSLSYTYTLTNLLFASILPKKNVFSNLTIRLFMTGPGLIYNSC